MKAKCSLTIDIGDAEKAKNILKSLKVDDLNFVKSRVMKGTLKAEISSNSIASLLHTLDDYLACLSIAIKVLDKD